MRNALSAERAVRLLYHASSGYVHRRARTRIGHVPNVHILNFVAYLYAAHTFDTLVRVADQGEVFRPCRFDEIFLKALVDDVEVVGKVLQRAVAAPDAGGAVRVVLG